MPEIVWRVVDGPSLVDSGIEAIERGCVCHVEFMEGDRTFGARPNGGVIYRSLDRFPVDFRFSVSVTDEQYGRYCAARDSQNGKPYDKVAIAWIALDNWRGMSREWESQHAWYCSELWTWILQQAGVLEEFPACVNNVTPQEALLISLARFTHIST